MHKLTFPIFATCFLMASMLSAQEGGNTSRRDDNRQDANRQDANRQDVERRREPSSSQESRGQDQSERYRSDSNREPSSRGSEQGQRPSRSEYVLFGRVLRTKQVDLRGGNTKELVALVRIGSGHRYIVDLGETRKLPNVRIHTGDAISVRGPFVKVGKYNVMLARRVGVDGRVANIERRPRSQGYRLSNHTREISGRIVNTRRVNLHNSDKQHMLARIRDDRGRLHIVDLGPSDRVRSANLQQDDRATIYGRDIMVDGRNLMLAYRIDTGEQSFRVSRDGDQNPSSRR